MPLPQPFQTATPTVVTAALLSGAPGEMLHLQTADGVLLRLSVTRDALAEIAALAGSALAQDARPDKAEASH